MADVIDVANYIFEISREESPDGEYELISHMKLQKLVYYCQGHFLALCGKPLFNDPIEAWTHGPVSPKLYHLLKAYGSLPITAVIDPQRIILDEREKRFISMVYDTYGQYSASRLRKMTHNEGPWKDTPLKCTIPHETMAEYFKVFLEVSFDDTQPWTDEERSEAKNILEKAEADGEIDLSQFCVSMGA